MITIVDCGISNTGSIVNMLTKSGIQARATSDAADVLSADRIILPGVGSFGPGMSRLREAGLVDALERRVHEHHVPILGICLGMHFLTRGSEEGGTPGLGWLDAETVRFRVEDLNPRPKVPHMGWNQVARSPGAFGWQAIDPASRFYFVHSYHVVCRDEADVFATTVHGRPFTSVVRRGNIVGVQFHPEKSHRFGMAVLREFAAS